MGKYSTDHLLTFKHINNVINTYIMCLNILLRYMRNHRSLQGAHQRFGIDRSTEQNENIGE